jgi:hypothetical protein
VKSGCPHGLPFQSHIKRVVGEDCFPVVVTLVQADTPAIPQVYGRYNFYYRPLSIVNNGEIIAPRLYLSQVVIKLYT